MAFGDVVKTATGASADPVTFGAAVSPGNSIVVMGLFRTFEGGAPTDVTDDVNVGSYTQAFAAGDITVKYFDQWFFSASDSGSPTLSFSGTTPYTWFLIELEGAISLSESSTGYSATDTTALEITAKTVAANSVTIAGFVGGTLANLSGLDPDWTKEIDATPGEAFSRKDATSTTATFSATSTNNAEYAAGWGSFVAAAPSVQTLRKGSTFDITTTLGTITTATLNGVNIADHISGQVGTTVSFVGLATDEITTSGEYSLVLGDGVGTETITVQVNVVGVAPSNNPLQKDGAALASLTGVQLRVTSGANINGTELFYSGTATTDASGNLSNIDLSSTAAAAADPVLLHMRTSAGDSIIASETVGLI